MEVHDLLNPDMLKALDEVKERFACAAYRQGINFIIVAGYSLKIECKGNELELLEIDGDHPSKCSDESFEEIKTALAELLV